MSGVGLVVVGAEVEDVLVVLVCVGVAIVVAFLVGVEDVLVVL